MLIQLGKNVALLWILRILAVPVVLVLFAAGFLLNLLYGVVGAFGGLLSLLGGVAAAAAGEHGHDHQNGQRKCKYLFHNFTLLFIFDLP